MILRKNEIKHYSGLQSELIDTLPSGDTFFCTDTNNLYKYNEDRKPYLIGCGNSGVPFIVEATPEGSLTFDSSEDMIYVSWNGGPGNFYLTLPDATLNTYRIIRIVDGGTVNANDRVHIVAPIGQTIDGANEYVLNQSYTGVQVWSDGSNWIVIQAKAH